jgi:hypothetical protein
LPDQPGGSQPALLQRLRIRNGFHDLCNRHKVT